MPTVKLGTKAVGSTIKLNLNGSPRELLIMHQGNPSTSMYAASCNGTWVRIKEAYENRTWDSSNNDYANSDVDAWLNGTFLNMLDPDIRERGVKQVKIPYRPGNGTGTNVNTGAKGLSCKAFLLSIREMGLSPGYSPNDGVTLAYYSGGGTKVINLNGSPARAWSRSPDVNGYNVCGVEAYGSASSWYYLSSFAVAPALILDSDLWVSDDGSILTNEPPTAPGSIDVTGVVSGGQATITLTAATDPDGTVASYRYERQVDDGGWQQFADVNSLTQTDQIESDWGTIAYRACAVDDAGAAGPYVTSETETINDSWIIISGPTSDMGSKTAPFDFVFSVSVTGQMATSITATAALDGEQVYSGTPNSGVQVTVPIDTRLLGAGSHTIEVNASKDEYLPASNSYTFTVPAVTIPDGGKGSQAQGQDGRAIFYTTLAQRCIGKDGKDVQAQIDALAARVKTLEG